VSRLSIQIVELSYVFFALGCTTSAEPLGAPPGNGVETGGAAQGGTSSASTSTAGGTPSTGGGASLGGGVATGGTPSVTVATGGAGTVVATGGSTGTATGAVITMSLPNLSTDGMQGTLNVTLPAGASPLVMSSVQLKLCGAGAGGLVTTPAMAIDNAQLMCPQTIDVNCPQGSTINLNPALPKISTSGTGASCCFVFDFTGSTNDLAVGGKLVVQYRQHADGGTTLIPGQQKWTAYIDGQLASSSCSIGSTLKATCTN